MPAAFSDDIKELVRSRTDIVSLIGETVALHSKGREFAGLCPFHDDHNPSMRVYPDRQSYRCWVCNEGGDCFNFVMARERINFREALEMLAQKANVEIPKLQRGQAAGEQDNKNRLYEVLAWAENEFHECLLKAPFAENARKYLAERGLTAETIRRFRLGFHPDNWEWLISRAGQGAAGRAKFSLENLFAVKLIGRNDRGGYYDNFVNRVMFPIRDAQGRPVAFGGRILPGASPADAAKYWNSPESPVFFKSRVLFALGEARDAIVKSDTVVVMEGYTDCIMAHQCGVTNVVGTLGTALTETHVTALKRFARKIVLVYDGDAAGQMASERALPKFLAQEVDLRVLTLPENFDPDEFLLERGEAAFNALLATAEEAWQKKLRIVVARHGLDSIDARHRVLREMLEVMAEVPSRGAGLAGEWQLRENIIFGALSQQLGITEERIREQLADVRQRKPLTTVRNTAMSEPLAELFPAQPTVMEQLERELLGHLFTSPAALPTIQQAVAPEAFSHPGLRALLTVCYELASRGVDPVYERVTATLEDSNLKRLAALVDQHAQRVNLTPEHLSPALNSFLRRLEPCQPAAVPGGPHVAALLASGGEMAGAATTEGLDAKTRLRQAMERHQKRISRKP